MKKSLLIIFSILILAVAALAISVSFYKPAVISKKKIVASIFPLYDIAKNIVGDKLDVVNVLPAGVSPHTFEPSPTEAAKIAGAQLIFVVGHGLDIWAERLAAANAPSAKIVTVDRGINLKYLEEKPDPHYFVSVTNAAIIARTILSEVSYLDPQNSNYYLYMAQNYDSYLQRLFSEGQQILADLSDRRIVTFHEAFSYFAADFGLSVVATIEPFPGKEPTGQYLSEVGEIIEKYKVKALFKEPQLSSAVLESLAKDKNVKILTLDPIGGVGERDSFIKMMQYNIRTIWEGLK